VFDSVDPKIIPRNVSIYVYIYTYIYVYIYVYIVYGSQVDCTALSIAKSDAYIHMYTYIHTYICIYYAMLCYVSTAVYMEGSARMDHADL
jgi:hypothetical protein